MEAEGQKINIPASAGFSLSVDHFPLLIILFMYTVFEVFTVGADAQFDVVYRGQVMNHVIPGRAVFFQRLKEYGGGYWFGRTYSDYYEFLIERPVSLGEGIDFLIHANAVAARHMEFDDDFKLEG